MGNNSQQQQYTGHLDWGYILEEFVHQRYFSGLIGSFIFFHFKIEWLVPVIAIT